MVRFQLRAFVLWLFVTALTVGIAIRTVIHRLEMRQSITRLAEEEDGNVWIFSESGSEVIGPDDSSPSEIYLNGLSPNDVYQNLQLVERVPSIKAIDLSGSILSPERLDQLRPNLSIQTLKLNYCRGLSSEVCKLVANAFPKSREIELVESDIDVDGLTAFSQIEEIRKLDVSRTGIPTSSIIQVCATFQQLDHLVLQRAELNHQLQEFCALDQLRVLDVSLGGFSAEHLEAFLRCAGPLRLIVIASEIEPAVVEGFEEQFPKVRIDVGARSIDGDEEPDRGGNVGT